VIFSVVYLVVRSLLGCLMVLARGEVSKDAELLVVRHEALVRREALGIEGGARPSRRVVAAAWQELSAVRSGRRR
jgi:hypothetical protein